ncbi:MAG: acyl-CoA dehydrogenase, partial [Mycobacterium sp.]|nr:acyl-CoA dehydrogenase [Mycobacterium sp.]
MAWDFEADPEWEAQLQWMRDFIETELIPLEPLFKELPRDEWTAVKRHLQDKVKAQGLWGAFLDPKLGGAGFGQLKLALMSEIIGRCMYSMIIFGVQAPDSGNMELLAHGATDAQKERWLWPNLRGEVTSAFALTEPFNAGADPTHITTVAVQ